MKLAEAVVEASGGNNGSEDSSVRTTALQWRLQQLMVEAKKDGSGTEEAVKRVAAPIGNGNNDAQRVLSDLLLPRRLMVAFVFNGMTQQWLSVRRSEGVGWQPVVGGIRVEWRLIASIRVRVLVRGNGLCTRSP